MKNIDLTHEYRKHKSSCVFLILYLNKIFIRVRIIRSDKMSNVHLVFKILLFVFLTNIEKNPKQVCTFKI